MNEIKQLLIISSILGACGLGFFLYKAEEGQEPELEEEPNDTKRIEEPIVKKQAKTRHNRRQINGTRRKSPTYV